MRDLTRHFETVLDKIGANHPIVLTSLGEGVPSELHGETQTRYFVIIRRLRPGAAALHHLLPPLLHDAVQVGEDLQRTDRKTDNGIPHTQRASAV